MKYGRLQPALFILVGHLLCITDLCRGIDHGMQDDWEVRLYMWDSLDGNEDVVQFEENEGHITVTVTLMIKIPWHADFVLYCTVLSLC